MIISSSFQKSLQLPWAASKRLRTEWTLWPTVSSPFSWKPAKDVSNSISIQLEKLPIHKPDKRRQKWYYPGNAGRRSEAPRSCERQQKLKVGRGRTLLPYCRCFPPSLPGVPRPDCGKIHSQDSHKLCSSHFSSISDCLSDVKIKTLVEAVKVHKSYIEKLYYLKRHKWC